MKLKADFFDDWVNVLKDVLSIEWQCNISSLPDSDIPLLYFNTENRRPNKQKRKVALADTFICPKELEAGFDRLVYRVENGKDLTMNLSKKVFSPNKKDPMLNEWGVHHFHLNENDDGSFSHGTKELLFAWLVDDIFFAIGIYDHNSWLDENVIEIMHRNLPAQMERYKVAGHIEPNELTIQQRKKLREAGVSVITSTESGESYFPIGGGAASNDFNLQAVMAVDYQKVRLKNLENLLTDILKYIKSDFEACGYDGVSDVEACLEATDTHYIAVFPKYEIGVLLTPKSDYIIPGFEKRCYGLDENTVVKHYNITT